MSRAQLTSSIWRVVARGGWWKPADVKAQLPDEFRTRDIAVKMWDMAHKHESLTSNGQRYSPRYAITRDCYVPAYAKVADVLDAKVAAEGEQRRECSYCAHRDTCVTASTGADCGPGRPLWEPLP